MKSTDVWLYLCASHKTPQSCSAIDYMIHQLDHSTAILNDAKNFDNRFEVKDASIKYLESISRRIYRLFSHTFFHHNDVYNEFEAKTHLCKRFTHFATEYNLLSSDQFIIKDSNLTATSGGGVEESSSSKPDPEDKKEVPATPEEEPASSTVVGRSTT